MSDLIDCSRDGPVAIIALNRPEQRNALTPELRDALFAQVDRSMADADCRALVLTGSGGTFSAGGDLKTMPKSDPLAARERLAALHRLFRRLTTGPKPVVAAVEGYAVGAGLSLALACDFIVAARDARFSAAFSRVGLMADMGLLWSLPLRVGTARARRMLMLAEEIGGRKAEEIGLIDLAVATGEAREEALRLAHRLAAAPPVAIALTKAAMARLPCSLDAVLDLELAGQALLLGTEDHAEGRQAFFEKRAPLFKGR